MICIQFTGIFIEGEILYGFSFPSTCTLQDHKERKIGGKKGEEEEKEK